MSLRQDSALRSRLKPHLRRHVISRFNAHDVSARALEVATLALETHDRAALRERIRNAPHIRSSVGLAEIRGLMRNTFGPPRRADLVMMQVRHSPWVQRYIDARLSRRLRQTETMSWPR
jgi:hypothetical protein